MVDENPVNNQIHKFQKLLIDVEKKAQHLVKISRCLKPYHINKLPPS